MSLAPEPFNSACLEVVYRAILEARVLAWGNARLLSRLSKSRQAQIADLMDVIHNIPDLLRDWEKCDQRRLREEFARYDKKWAHRSSLSLGRIYDETIEKLNQI